MSAAHDHSHTGAAGGSATPRYRKKLALAFALTSTVFLAQLVGSVVTGSLALLTDTFHALADVSGLLVALIAATLMARPADAKRTWGFQRVEVLAALGQSTVLLGVGIYAAVEGVKRLIEPPEVPGVELLVFGIVGLAANVASILILSSSRGGNFNMRAAFLEVVNDALGSLAVIVAAIVIATTGYQRADAIAGLIIAALIAPRAFILMRDTIRVLMEFAPDGLDLDEVRQHILAIEHVKDVHDLHASTVATGLPTISAHIIVQDECFTDGHAPQMLKRIQDCVAEHFPVSIHHSTFQIETESNSRNEDTGVRHP